MVSSPATHGIQKEFYRLTYHSSGTIYCCSSHTLCDIRALGPTFSSDVMSLQRGKLRQHYGLPPEPVITNLKIPQIPPSERSLPPSVYYGSSK
ncbi:MAG: hypothetical protein WAJ93_28320 [Candidatus Nitrosopolaris sp.]